MKTPKTRPSKKRIHLHRLRSRCPIANALDLIGDRWTLVIMRDILMLGKRTYKDLSQSDEVVPTNILAERLSRLLENGLIEKKAYQKRPVRYEYQPTPKGQDLWPVLAAITRWSNRYLPGTNVPPPGFLDSYKTDEGRAHLELGEPK